MHCKREGIHKTSWHKELEGMEKRRPLFIHGVFKKVPGCSWHDKVILIKKRLFVVSKNLFPLATVPRNVLSRLLSE